jgi:hypothetical protein
MLTTQCSFCQCQNVPGARFCAECGSPLHLKVCAKCGKVGEVEATTCESCGTAFPKIDLIPLGTTPGVAPSPEPPPKASKPGIAPWPLIVMAIVAGGLPLLWVNRSYLPIPKTWQNSAPAPVEAVVVTEPPVAQAPAPVAMPPESSPAPTPTADPVEPPVAPGDADQTGTALEANPGAEPVKTPSTETAKRPAASKPVKKAEAPRTCTEALAAMGLCDPRKTAR